MLPWTSRVHGLLERFLPWISALWALGTAFMALRLAGGWATGRRWRAEAQEAPAVWQARLEALAEQMARRGASLVVGSGYSLDIRDVRRLCPKSFLLLPECDGENAVPAFDEYGHGAMTVDFDLQFAPDAAAAVDSAVREMKQWVTVV